MSKENIPAEMTFEAALAELHSILEIMEGGKAPLEQVVELARRGEELLVLCHAKISSAERLVEELTITPDGELVTQPLDYEDDEEM